MVTQYQRCKKMLDSLEQKRFNYSDMVKLIKLNLGSSEETIKSNLAVMLDLGLIKIDKMGWFEVQ